MLFNCNNEAIDSRIQALTGIGLNENKLWAQTIQLAYALFKENRNKAHADLLKTDNEFISMILNGLWKENTEESKKCFIMVCEKLLEEQNATAAGFLGRAYYEGKYVKPDKQKAISLLDLAYTRGNNLMLPYYLDKLWQINDPESNDKYVKIATVESNKGNAEAKARLGRAYRDARSVVQNLDKAESLEREALAEGIKWAKYDLADVLWRKCTYTSLKEMSQLLDPLVKTNDYEAIARIARMYRDGKGKPKNIQLSKELFEKALSGGVRWAKTELDRLEASDTFDTSIYYSTRA